MFNLDVRTVVFGQLATGLVGALVMVALWWQNRHRFEGTAWWMVDFILQGTASLLIVLRGSIPDWMSVVLANTLVAGGALAGLIGLERFVGRKGPQFHNYLLLVVFVCVHSYYAFVEPNLTARNLNVSLALLILCFQCMWLLWRRVEPSVRQTTRDLGLVFWAFCFVSVVRIGAILLWPQPDNDFFRSGLFDILVLVTYQILLILLAYGLTLMVNRRLLTDVQIQEEKFAKAFRSSPYAITLTRLSDGRIFDVNDGFEHITGYTHDEVIGRTTLDLGLWTTEADRVRVVSELSQCHTVQGMEFEFRTKTGRPLTGLFSAEIITINDQHCVLSSISDITERKRAEEQLRISAADLARSNKELEQFAYIASHDLQEPLRMVSSYLQLIAVRYRGQLDQDADDFIGFAVDGAQRMQQVINDLLEYARVSTRGRPLHPTAATHAIRQAVRNLELAIKDAGATVTWDELPTVPADDTQLMQVFQNLIGNAIKFRGTEPPRVHVSAQRVSGEAVRGDVVARERERVGEWGNGGMGATVPLAPTPPLSSTWQFAVRDNGIGIVPEYHARIFDVFQRLHTREAYEGTGIGLAICKKIVERHGGRIWVESQPGQGATFYFTLPEVATDL